MNTTNIAVITGDIVKSQTNSPDEYRHLIWTLEFGLKQINERIPLEYELFRGDSFQIKLNDYSRALEIALLLRLFLKSKHSKSIWDARVGIGIGESSVDTYQIKTSTGAAYRLSGLAFDDLRTERLRLLSSSSDLNETINLLSRFTDLVITQLTQTQARYLSYYLWYSPIIHKELAEKLNASRVNTTQILNSANYKLIEDFIAFTKKTLERAL